MNKIISWFKLKGQTKKEDILIKGQKYLFLFNKILKMFLSIPYFTMGETLHKNVIAINSYGKFFCRKETYDLHIISDTYEFEIRKLFEKLSKKSKIIIDVGANIGKYTILASKSNPNSKIFAIEPEQENFNILRKNVELNKLKNVKLIKIALNNKNGKLKIYKEKINMGGHSIKNQKNCVSFENVIGKKFEDLFENELNYIDLLKIDAEGAEFEILEGSKKFLKDKRIKKIIIEINDLKTKNFLEKYGYKLKKIQYNNYLAI